MLYQCQVSYLGQDVELLKVPRQVWDNWGREQLHPFFQCVVYHPVCAVRAED